jgi:hypothetical protein
MIRKKRSNRRVTTQCQKPPSILSQPLVNFIMFIRKRQKERQYQYGNKMAADETAVWIDLAGRIGVNRKGAKGIVFLLIYVL